MPVHTCPLEGAVEQRMASTQRPASQCCACLCWGMCNIQSSSSGGRDLPHLDPSPPILQWVALPSMWEALGLILKTSRCGLEVCGGGSSLPLDD